MASFYYNDIGKTLLDSGSDYLEISGLDFGDFYPSTYWSAVSDYRNRGISGETSYNLSGYQPMHSVCGQLIILATGTSSGSGQVTVLLQGKVGGSWGPARFTWNFPNTYSQNRIMSIYAEFCIMTSMIWTDATEYRLLTHREIGSESGDATPIYFNVSGLNIDDVNHNRARVWVSGNHLFYTDYYGYKHSIAYDGNFSEYVGSNKAGYMWYETDVVRRLYYIDEYGYKRRTYQAPNWYGYPNGQGKSSGSSSNKGYLRVSDGTWLSSGLARLCFVNQAGYIMPLMNGPVAGVT